MMSFVGFSQGSTGASPHSSAVTGRQLIHRNEMPAPGALAKRAALFDGTNRTGIYDSLNEEKADNNEAKRLLSQRTNSNIAHREPPPAALQSEQTSIESQPEQANNRHKGSSTDFAGSSIQDSNGGSETLGSGKDGASKIENYEQSTEKLIPTVAGTGTNSFRNCDNFPPDNKAEMNDSFLEKNDATNGSKGHHSHAPFIPVEGATHAGASVAPQQSNGTGDDSVTGTGTVSTTQIQQQLPVKRSYQMLEEPIVTDPEENQSPKLPSLEKRLKMGKPGTAVETISQLKLAPEALQQFDDNNSLKDGGDSHAIARLAKLFEDAGGEDESGLFEIWTNPNLESSWHRRVPFHRELPILPMDSTLLRSRPRRSSESAATAVQEVWVDGRFYGVSEEYGPEIVRHSERKIRRMAPLDGAPNDRLRPADSFLEQIREGYEGAITEPEYQLPGLASPQRRRGRRRNPQRGTSQHMSPSQKRRETKSSKAAKPTEASSRVGGRYQARVPPLPLSGNYKRDQDVPDCDQIWDPEKAKAAISHGEDIDGFLNQSVDTSSKTLLMEALHRANYSVKRATYEYVTLYRKLNGPPSCQLPLEDIIRADELFQKSKKDFNQIAKTLGQSVSAVLVEYYRWKGSNDDGCYTKLKQTLRNDFYSDYCAVCDDGGELIVCDDCQKAYHLECLDPPLSKVPLGDWFCNECMKFSARIGRHRAQEEGKQESQAARQLAFSGAMSSSSGSEQDLETTIGSLELDHGASVFDQTVPRYSYATNIYSEVGDGTASQNNDDVIDLTTT